MYDLKITGSNYDESFTGHAEDLALQDNVPIQYQNTFVGSKNCLFKVGALCDCIVGIQLACSYLSDLSATGHETNNFEK